MSVNDKRRNPIYINKISLNNYRTYENLTIEFTQNIHTLVGPNECGKTNLLFAFGLFNNSNLLKKSDICCYVEEIFETEPEIIFSLNPIYPFEVDDEKIKEILITYKGKHRSVSSLPNIKVKEIEKIYNCSIIGTLTTGKIHIILPELIKLLKLPSDHHLIENKEYGFITDSEDLIDKIVNYFSNHEFKDNIQLTIKEDYRENVKNLNVDDIIKKIKFVNWTFREDYYIPSVIPLSDLQSHPEKHQSIKNFFKIAKIKLTDFLSITDHNIRNNILRRVNKEVSQVLSESWTQYQDVEIDITLGTDNALHIGFLENGHSIDPKRRSLGFQWFFAFLLYFNANFGNELKNCVILLDEPGIFLHPGGQKDLLKEIEKLSINNQIIYTTHLPFMINRNHPERIIFLSKKRGITFLEGPRKEGVFDDVLLANTLGFNFSSLSNFGELNLFVEGITDKILIEDLAIKYSQTQNDDLLDLNYISIIPVNGISNFDSFIRVAQETKINFLVLIDADEIGKKLYSKYSKNSEKYNDAIAYFFILSNDNEIEDLIPFELYSLAFKKVKTYIEPWNEIITDNVDLIKGRINPQLKRIISDIKENLEQDNNRYESDLITVGQLKLDVMIELKRLITEENYENFKDLINVLKKINTKGKEIIRKLRSS